MGKQKCLDEFGPVLIWIFEGSRTGLLTYLSNYLFTYFE